jgi:gliding motility-associated-like protein
MVTIAGNPDWIIDSAGGCKNELVVNVINRNNLSSNKNFFWNADFGDGFSKNLLDSSTAVFSHAYSSPGKYTVKISSSGVLGCQTTSQTKEVYNYAIAKAGFLVGDTCLGMPVLLRNTTIKGFGNNGYAFAKWTIGGISMEDTSATFLYTFPKPGVYDVKLIVQGSNSCSVDSLTKEIMVIGNPLASFVFADSCAGFDVNFTDKSVPYLRDQILQRQWSFNDGSSPSFAQNPAHIFSKGGSYFVKLTVQSAFCPQLFDDTLININVTRARADLRYPIVYAVKNIPLTLNPYPNGRTYLWSPNLNLNNNRAFRPLMNADFLKRDYLVKVTDSSGCVNTDSVLVYGFNSSNIYLPTAFSPNNDGNNDVYKAEYILIDHIEFFKIVDKFNNTVFETNNMNETWNGMYQGKPLPGGVYLAVVSGVDTALQRIQKKVSFILLR